MIEFSTNYLESINQEVMVLFDEFDKTFGEVRQSDGEASPQAHLLSLFDILNKDFQKTFLIHRCTIKSKIIIVKRIKLN